MTASNIELKRYKKEFAHSYSIGVFPTIELVTSAREQVIRVIVSTKGERNEGVGKLKQICERGKIPFELNDKAVERIAPNENAYAIGVFSKYEAGLEVNANHVALVNPSDMGNLGTIIRTMLGFGYGDLALVRPAADIFDPKVVRASMGALFRLRFSYFDSFREYRALFSRELYPFMTDGKRSLHNARFAHPHTLVFGNEGAGLPDEYRETGTSVTIPHSAEIDSLNLPIAVSIALYEASKEAPS